MNADRRLQERKLPERIVLCKLGEEETSSVLNLSEDGLRFDSLTPIEKTGVLQLRLSAELDGTIETAGRLAWIDSGKRTGGLRFLELTAQAREKIRAWLSETSSDSSARSGGAFLQKRDTQALDYPLTYRPATDKLATYKPAIWQATRVPSMQLVPIERHRRQKRRQFLLGVFLGFGTCAALIIAYAWFAGGMKPVSLSWTTVSASPAAQSSAEQTEAPAVPRTSASPPISQPTATKPLATEPPAVQRASVAAPARSLQNQRPTQTQKQSPPSVGASSTNRMTHTSLPPSLRNGGDTPQPATPGERVASSRPSTKEQPLAASQGVVAPVPASSNALSSSGPMEHQAEGPVEGPVEQQVQHPKKVPPTPEQLWSALQKGNVKAAVALADLYARGEGVPLNCEQARVLLLAASEKKNAEASKKLQELDKGGCPANSASE